MIAVTAGYPERPKRFQRRVLCYETWLLAYQGLLVSTYPRFKMLA